MLEQNKTKNDATTILIGFSLILVISVLFFLKFHFVDQKNQAQLAEKDLAEVKKEMENFQSITAADLSKKISAKEKILILDAREADSFNAEHIIDSKNFSLDGLKENISNFDKDGEYFFVDDFGLTPNEIQAMKIFKDSGITKIAYLEGGITNWKNEYEPTIGLGDPFSLSDRSKVSFIKSDDLKTELSYKKSLYLVDIRSSAEYKKGHIAGAINIYLDDIESRRHELPLGAKIVLYDNSGVGAFQAAVRLFDVGILNAYALSDGLNEWKQKGFEIVVAN